MIRILAKEYSRAVALLCAQLDKESAQYDVYFSHSQKMLTDRLISANGLDALFLVGDTWNWCETFAEAFGLAIVYDKFAEKKVAEYCKLSNIPMPAQYILDKCCSLPETFIHFSSCSGFQCACGGEYHKCHVYILPNDAVECKLLFDDYIKKDLFKQNQQNIVYCFKLFGLSEKDLNERLVNPTSKLISVKSETENLDSKVTLTFSRNCAKKVVNDYIKAFCDDFKNYIYANSDITPAAAVVSLLNERYKMVAVAESLTGGIIASHIVDVPGASNVFYEGAVTYSVDSKCKRLGLNPHFVDEYGVVSAQVAKEMALSQLKNADYSLSTTGYAGPTAEGNYPVGLCYIGVGAKLNGTKYVKVFKNIFSGDRNGIRNCVANTALFLLTEAIKNNEFFEKTNLGETKQ